MSSHLQVSLIGAMIIYFIIIFNFLKNKVLNLKYTLLWLFSGVVMLTIAIFPNIMLVIANLFGIVSVINALFALLIFFILLILMALTGIVSKFRNQNRQLVQSCALLELRIRELEKKENECYFIDER